MEAAQDEKLRTLSQWVSESRCIVFFGGAGVSTKRHPGLPQPGRPLQPAVGLSAGNHFEPHLF